MGQYLPKLDVRVRSAFPLIAIKLRTSRHFGFGLKADVSNGSKAAR